MNYTRSEIFDWISNNLEPEELVSYLGIDIDDLIPLIEEEISDKLEVFDELMVEDEP